MRWNGSSLDLVAQASWSLGSDSSIEAVVVGDVDRDGTKEIVLAGDARERAVPGATGYYTVHYYADWYLKLVSISGQNLPEKPGLSKSWMSSANYDSNGNGHPDSADRGALGRLYDPDIGDLNSDGNTEVVLVGEWVWVGWHVKILTIQAAALPTPTLTATPQTAVCPTPPATSMTFGYVTVHADTFTDMGNGLCVASNNVRVGNYIPVAGGTITVNTTTNMATGTGLLSLKGVTLTTSIIRDSFDLNGLTGIITPLLTTGYSLTLQSLGQFQMLPYNFSVILDATAGSASGKAVLDIPIGDSGNSVFTGTVQFTLGRDGAVSGYASDMAIEVAGCRVALTGATLSNRGLSIDEAELTLPEALGGISGGAVYSLTITSEGITVGGGGISVSLPAIKVSNSFSLAEASATLKLQGGTFMIEGSAGFSLPNIKGERGIAVSFKLTQAGLSHCCLGGTADPGIPIGQTGFVLTGMEGCVNLSPLTVQVAGTLESTPELPGIGPAISGQPLLYVRLEKPHAISITGQLEALSFDAAQAALSLSQDRGLDGSLAVSAYSGAVSGNANVHVWKGSDAKIHFTGSAVVDAGFDKGELGSFFKVDVPPFDMNFSTLQADFGEFCVNQACTSHEYGIKSSVTVRIALVFRTAMLERAFFVGADGTLSSGGDLDQYALVQQTALAQGMAQGVDLSATHVYTVPIPATSLVIFGLEWEQGIPGLELTDPQGRIVQADPASLYPGLGYTVTTASTVFFIAEPLSGTWQARVTNVTGGEDYTFGALGANQLPIVEMGQPTSGSEREAYGNLANGNGLVLHWTATDPDGDAIVSLYYDTDNTGTDGIAIVAGLTETVTSYVWDTSDVPSGDCYVYVVVDDRKHKPTVAYSQAPVHVENTEPPSPPSGVRAVANVGAFDLYWNVNPERDVIGYRVHYGTASG